MARRRGTIFTHDAAEVSLIRQRRGRMGTTLDDFASEYTLSV